METRIFGNNVPKTRPGLRRSTFDPLIPYRIGDGGSPKGSGSRRRRLVPRIRPPTIAPSHHRTSLRLLGRLRRRSPRQIPDRQSKVARILRQHPRQRDIIRDESRDDPKRPPCGVYGPAAGELGDEEEEEGYVQEKEEGGEGD